MAEFKTYAESGVDIDANDVMVERIRSSVSSTFGPRVIDLPGGFAGMFRLDYDEKIFKRNYKNPVLVACTDGVGTKVKLAQMAGVFFGFAAKVAGVIHGDGVAQVAFVGGYGAAA